MISGNSSNGIRVTGGVAAADHNSISNNYIGTNLSGNAAVANGRGVYLDHVSNTLVNGNIISGNNADGIRIVNSLGVFNTVQSNFIGVNASGSVALGNLGNGVSIVGSGGSLVTDSSGATSVVGGILIGGSHANGNIISGNSDGISLEQASYVKVQGNNIGTDNSGAIAIENSGNGVTLSVGSHDNTIGGTRADLRNLIEGATDGIYISTGASAYNLIIGNHIGTDETGTIALGSGVDGVYVASAGSVINGNLISGWAQGPGIYLLSAATIQGNLIGTQGDGTTPLPNQGDGIDINGNGSLIGGSPSQGNVIAFNAGTGITILSGNQNTLRGNSIYANTGLGIDLNGDGVTPNGPANTAQSGPNNYVNYPVLSTVVSSSTSTTITGTYVGLASSTYTLELFSNTSPDPTLYGQGKTYIGSVTLTTDATGNATFTTTVSTLPPSQSMVTATATDAAGNTSEFSMVVQATFHSAPASTTTQLSTSNASVFEGTAVTFTAKVLLSGTTTPSGTVMFEEVLSGGTMNVLGTVPFSGGPVSLTVSNLSVGVHNIIAVYSGDSNYSASTSDPLAETIKSSKVTINGTTFRDTTGDGLSGDDGAMAGVTVNLYRDANNNGVLDSGDGPAIAHVVTDTTGAYSFGNMTAGRYFVQEVTPTGYIRTAPALSTYYTVNSTAGTVYSGRDFDNYLKCNDRQWVTGISYSVNGSNTWFSDLRGHIHEGNAVKVRFMVASNHTAKLTLVSYTAPGSSFDANKANLQSVYQFATGTFSPGMHTMQVTIPASYFQVDFVCGDYIDHFGPAGSNVFYSAQNRLISADNGGTHTQLLSLLGADMSALNT